MKLLVAGAKGQLGRDCMSLLGSKYEVIGLDLPELDITDAASVRSAIGALLPGVIVNCAAFTRVDDCEKSREEARKANALGPRHLAELSRELGCRLIHISTDYVFDGRRSPPRPYIESDEPCPLSWYGQTKLEGEQAVRESTDRFAILRTAWLYGRHGHNFPKTMLRLALKDPDKPIRVVNDQYGSPTWSCRLAAQIDKLIAHGGQGIYHATSDGYCTWCDFARSFLDLMEVRHHVVPCSTKEYPTPALRPANSILENSRLKAAGINVMGDWQSALAEFVTAFREELLQETR